MTTAQKFEYIPDRVLPPGETLQEVIDERDMTQAELALRTGLSTKHVNQIIKGTASITAETAVLLERATGVSAPTWTKLESAFQIDQSLRDEDDRLASDLDWLTTMPVAELEKRKYIATTTDAVQRLREVCNFFGVASPAIWTTVWEKPTAFRLSKTFTSDPGATASWLRIGEIRAAAIETEPFDKAQLQAGLPMLRALTRLTSPEDWHPQLCDTLAACGVAVVLEPEISGARVIGAARWLTPTKAMIQLSLRHKKSDIFWFTVFHEIGHLLLHSKKDIFIDDNTKSPAESEADAFAARTLIPREFEDRLATLSNEAAVLDFAREVGVGPDIVVGRLQFEQRWPYNRGNRLKRSFTFIASSD